MKRITLILTILVTIVCCSQLATDTPKRQGWNDAEFGPLYGNIESVTITEYSLKDHFGVLSRSKMEKKVCYNFNESGDVTEEAEYDSVELRWKYTYKYDSEGNMTEFAYYHSSNDYLSRKTIYKYDRFESETYNPNY